MSLDKEFEKEIRRDFLNEATHLLEEIDQSYLRLENPANRKEELGKIFRLAHSLKGGGQAVGFIELSQFAHMLEDLLSALRLQPHKVDTKIISLLLLCGDAIRTHISVLKIDENSVWDEAILINEIRAATKAITATTPPESARQSEDQDFQKSEDSPEKNTGLFTNTVRVDSTRIEHMLDLVGEIVVLKSQILNGCAEYPSNIRLNTVATQLDKSVRDLQDRTLSMRMAPLKSLFFKVQRLVRDLSAKTGKEVAFHMSGEETEIDRSMVELLSDPLIHLARNSIDHGLENAEQRRKTGKSKTGNIHLSAQKIGGRVIILIKDDGAGINRDKVINKAIENKMLAPDQDPKNLADHEVFNFIFEPGFSTAEVVSDISGRGVGMDVVKTNLEKMKGNIEVTSQEGKGTAISLSLPLTMSVTQGMIVRARNSHFIIPMDYILELVKEQKPNLVDCEDDRVAINHRGALYPIHDLEETLFELPRGKKIDVIEKTLVLVQAGPSQIMISVDELLEQTQIVLKPLSENFKNIQGVSGATILGDGKVALVVNPYSLHIATRENKNSYEKLSKVS